MYTRASLNAVEMRKIADLCQEFTPAVQPVAIPTELSLVLQRCVLVITPPSIQWLPGGNSVYPPPSSAEVMNALHAVVLGKGEGQLYL
jgi:hypothetical protein